MYIFTQISGDTVRRGTEPSAAGMCQILVSASFPVRNDSFFDLKASLWFHSDIHPRCLLDMFWAAHAISSNLWPRLKKWKHQFSRAEHPALSLHFHSFSLVNWPFQTSLLLTPEAVFWLTASIFLQTNPAKTPWHFKKVQKCNLNCWKHIFCSFLKLSGERKHFQFSISQRSCVSSWKQDISTKKLSIPFFFHSERSFEIITSTSNKTRHNLNSSAIPTVPPHHKTKYKTQLGIAIWELNLFFSFVTAFQYTPDRLHETCHDVSFKTPFTSLLGAAYLSPHALVAIIITVAVDSTRPTPAPQLTQVSCRTPTFLITQVLWFLSPLLGVMPPEAMGRYEDASLASEYNSWRPTNFSLGLPPHPPFLTNNPKNRQSFRRSALERSATPQKYPGIVCVCWKGIQNSDLV